MSLQSLGRWLHAFVVCSVLLGAALLWQVDGLLPASVFDVIAVGWIIYVGDAILFLFKPLPATLLAFLLAFATLGISLGQPAHWALVLNGATLPAVTFVAGNSIQVLIVVVTPVYLLKWRKDKAPPPSQMS